jgi:hypothetical protein
LEKRGTVFGARRFIAQGGYPLGILLSSLMWTLFPQDLERTGVLVFMALGAGEVVLAAFLLYLATQRKERQTVN